MTCQNVRYRIEKRRTEAALTLTTGATVRGCFFLAGARARHGGPERVADLLNAEPGFFPFEMHADGRRAPCSSTARTWSWSRLLDDTIEAQLDPGYGVATVRDVRMMLSNGETVEGRVRVYRPAGRDRLSDYARLPQAFSYIETDDGDAHRQLGAHRRAPGDRRVMKEIDALFHLMCEAKASDLHLSVGTRRSSARTAHMQPLDAGARRRSIRR